MERTQRTRPPATLASLAAELGVSRTTVSNAYNRPDQLSPQLRSRVMEAARRLGYPGPDPVARSLRTRKAGAIGLLLTEQLSYAFRDPAAVAFLEGLSLECDQARIGLLLVPASPDSEDVRAVSSARGRRIRRLLDAGRRSAPGRDDRPAGAVGDLRPAVPRRHRPGRHRRRGGDARDGRPPDRSGSPADRGDLHAARPIAAGTGRSMARAASAHYHVQRNRLAGLRDAFAAAGVAWDRVPVVERFEHSVAAGASATAEVLTLDPGITAVIATSDVLALGAIEEVQRRRQRVPEDVSVTGFDGIRAAGEVGPDDGGPTRGGQGPAGGSAAPRSGSASAGPQGDAADHVPSRPEPRARRRGCEPLADRRTVTHAGTCWLIPEHHQVAHRGDRECPMTESTDRRDGRWWPGRARAAETLRDEGFDG